MASAPDPAASAFVRPARAVASPLERAAALFSLFPHRRAVTLATCLALVATIALADLATGYEFALSLLYLAPVFACTWVLGVRAGLGLSVVATLAWLATDIFAGHEYSQAAYRYWEFVIKLSTFGLFAVMLGALKHALERSDDRLIKVLEGLDAAVCVIDPATDAIVYRNRRFVSVCAGRERVDSAQDVRELLSLADPRAGAATDGAAAVAIGERWLLVRARTLAWTDARPVTLVTATDITEQRLAEQSRREQQARLEATARMVAVGEIASSIAHELNQPLATILNNAEAARKMLARERVDLAELREICNDIVDEDHRAAGVIRRLRTLFKGGDMQLQALDANELVQDTLALLHTELLMRQVVAVTHLAPSLPVVDGGRVQLQQVLLNLFVNAADAMEVNAVEERQLVIRTDTTGRDVRIFVSDCGPGIAGADLKNIFEPFWSSKPGGMGMGLAICRSIVAAHGGSLTAANGEDRGATFCVALPVRQAA
jgi:signal transduction histidine kinase